MACIHYLFKGNLKLKMHRTKNLEIENLLEGCIEDRKFFYFILRVQLLKSCYTYTYHNKFI